MIIRKIENKKGDIYIFNKMISFLFLNYKIAVLNPVSCL